MALRRKISLLAALVALVGAERMPAPSTFTWIGNGASGDVNLVGNWQSGSKPAGDGLTTEDVTFGNLTGAQANPLLPSSGFILHSLLFNDTGRPAYTFSGTSNPTFQLTGDITVATSGGTVTFDSTFNVNLTSGTHTVTLTPSGAQMTVASAISGSGADIVKSGAGTLTLSGNNSYTGTTTITSGVLSVNSLANGGANSAIGASTNAAGNLVIDGGTLAYTGAATNTNRLFTVGTNGATIDSSGSGALNFTNGGALALSGTNTARTIILTGTASSNAFGLIIGDNGSGATSLTKTGTGSWTLLSDNTLTGITTVNAGTLQLGGGGASTGSVAGNIVNNSALVFNHTGTATPYNGVISGTGTVTKNGSGTDTLGGANTFTGSTTINAGTLSVSSLANGGSASGIGASSNSASNLVINGGTLKYTGATASTNRLFQLGNSGGTIDSSGAGVLTFNNSGSITHAGTSARSLTLTGTAGDTTSQNNLGVKLVNTGAGALSVIKNGSGAWILSAANTFTGGVTLNLGDLYLSNDSALGAPSSTLNFAGASAKAHFTGSRTIDNNLNVTASSGTVVVQDTMNDVMRLNGAISGNQLSVEGDGILQLYGNSSSWAGGLYLNSGATRVEVRNANALGSGALLFSSMSDANVDFKVSATITGLASASDPSSVSVSNGSTLTINQNSDSTFAGYIQDGGSAGTIIKTGTGAITLTNTNNGYSSGWQINNGTVIADGSGSSNSQTGAYGSNSLMAIGSSGRLVAINTSLDNKTTTVSGRISGNASTIGGDTNVLSGGIIAPGYTGNPIGILTFNDLSLSGGGILEWNLQNPNGTAGSGFDSVEIKVASGTLHLDSLTTTNRFTIKIISVDGGNNLGTAVGFLNQPYTWTLFNANGAVFTGGFNSNLFTIDTSMFAADIGLGNFTLSADDALNPQKILLTFTPVPEPSTWALLASGAGVVAFFSRRRKKSA